MVKGLKTSAEIYDKFHSIYSIQFFTVYFVLKREPSSLLSKYAFWFGKPLPYKIRTGYGKDLIVNWKHSAHTPGWIFFAENCLITHLFNSISAAFIGLLLGSDFNLYCFEFTLRNNTEILNEKPRTVQVKKHIKAVSILGLDRYNEYYYEQYQKLSNYFHTPYVRITEAASPSQKTLGPHSWVTNKNMLVTGTGI